MRALRSAQSITKEIASCTDPSMFQLIAARQQYASECAEDDIADLLTVFFVDPGDTLQAIDAELGGGFLTNHFSGKAHGDPDFKPAFETLEEYPTFYEMFFVQSDEGYGVSVLIPKHHAIDQELLALCERYAVLSPDCIP